MNQKFSKLLLHFLLTSIFCTCTWLIPIESVAQYSTHGEVNAKVVNLVKELKFRVLSQNQSTNRLTMNILVPPSTTKQQALYIAKRIKESFPGFFLFVSIFDSTDAYKNRDNERYPQAKYFRHYLVQITQNPHTGFNEIQWTAKGRK